MFLPRLSIDAGGSGIDPAVLLFLPLCLWIGMEAARQGGFPRSLLAHCVHFYSFSQRGGNKMKVTVVLRNDHEALRSLFEGFTNAGVRNQNGKKELFGEIQREILIHSQMESEIFYPALTATSSTVAQDLVAAAERDHRAVEELLEELSEMNAQEKSFDAKFRQLMVAVNQHIDKEEEEIFDEARKNLPEYRLEELGLEMEDRRKILNQLAA
jgi:hemerythrin superfamily protein